MAGRVTGAPIWLTNRHCAIVMQDGAKAAPVFVTESTRERLGECITDRIRVAQTLPLDNLDRFIGRQQRRNDEMIHLASPQDAACAGAWSPVVNRDRQYLIVEMAVHEAEES
jgi:hypothetical protein